MGIGVQLPEGRFYVDVRVGGPLFTPVDFSSEPLINYCSSGVRIHRKPGTAGTFYFDHLLRGEKRLRWEFDPCAR